MQYGVELLTYNRKKKAEIKKKAMDPKRYGERVVIFFVAILICRVLLINKTAPFGIAFMISIIMLREPYNSVIAGIGAILGYLSVYSNINNFSLYIVSIAIMVVGDQLINRIFSKRKLLVLFILVFVENIIYNYLINSYSNSVNALVSIFDVMCIIPLYFIINYSIICIKEVRLKHIFTNEEMISIAIICAIVISGSWGISVGGVTLRNILALCFVIIIAFVSGSSNGSAAGLAVGVILGMTTDNIMVYISVYGLCGFVIGLFKETGKLLSASAYLVCFSLLKLYTKMGSEFKLIEVIIALLIVLAIPKVIYTRLTLEFDGEKKVESMNKVYLDMLKNTFVGKLRTFSDLLFNMSHTVKNIVSNDKLLMKSKSSAMVENLADRVCSNCNMNTMCWKREIHYTYNAFTELLKNYQENNRTMPDELERKCIKRGLLVSNTDEIVTNHMVDELCRNRLIEGREIIGGHLNNIAEAIGQVVDEFSCELVVNDEIERALKKQFNRNSIEYSSLFCYEDRNAKVHVEIHLEKYKDRENINKNILPLVVDVVGVNMEIREEVVMNKSGGCDISFHELPKYSISTYVARACKDGENYNGDSYSFGKLKDSNYMIIISDGMGSGPQAREESKAAVDLVERFADAGFSKYIAIETVNSIMNMKYSEEEKFSTIDIVSVDLFSGNTSIMKVGAVATFLKNKSGVEIISSKTLPIGVLDRVDVDVFDRKVTKGDIIVMVSDGVLECDENNFKMDKWIQYYLEESLEYNPKSIADTILEKTKEINKGRVRDDITIVVSKVYV